MSIRNDLINSWFLPESFWKTHRAYASEADFICPQAFGRNTYSDKEVGTVVNSIIDLSDNVVDRFVRLGARGFDPGHPNKILALRSIRFAKLIHPFFDNTDTIRPVIGQWEVLYAMWLYEPDWYAKHQNLLTPIWPPIIDYLTTHGVFRIAKDIADGHGLKKPLLIAHPEHIQRCFFIARKIFGKPVAIDVAHASDSEWFDKASVQKWTRSPSYWLPYEMLARIHHRFHSWM
ncbi:MAG: hypothetical protein HYV45_01400 [Candidatus Moranbacteria bacterium]|nr:hypothetical protein [Candidatus Moranbacteria bacterium]